jgi:gluconokinase
MAERRRAIVVMGVCGCGKTSVGEGIAAGLGAPFVEGDALHPAGNVAKMSAGTPLTDADRWPWLREIAARIADEPRAEIVVSCSALRRSYRDLLRAEAGRAVAFVFLEGSEAVLSARLGARDGHFMPPALLASQLATLEDPRGEPGVITVDIDASVGRIVAAACSGLGAGADAPRS